MGRPSREEQEWTIANQALMRQFKVRSGVLLVGLAGALFLTNQNRRLIVDALGGGAWMIVNCVAMVWMGRKALRHHQTHSERYLLGFIAGLLVWLSLGGWFVVVRRPSLLWLTVGLTIPLGVFLYQLVRLRFRLDSNAR